jgi:hypothetical protein
MNWIRSRSRSRSKIIINIRRCSKSEARKKKKWVKKGNEEVKKDLIEIMVINEGNEKMNVVLKKK